MTTRLVNGQWTRLRPESGVDFHQVDANVICSARRRVIVLGSTAEQSRKGGFLGARTKRLARRWASAVAFLVGAVGLSGCLGTASIVKALGKDPATVCTRINTIYGTLQIARTNCPNCNVVCNSDGLSVKSDGAAVGVPIQLVPQFSITTPR